MNSAPVRVEGSSAFDDVSRIGRGRPDRGWAWLLPAVALVLFSAVIPLGVLIRRFVDIGAVTATFALPSVREAIRFSIWQGLWSTMTTLIIGTTLAWILSQYEFRGRRLVHAAATIPFVLPTVIVAGAFLALLPTSIERSVLSIVLAHVFFNVSVVVRLVSPSWSLLDPDLLRAARSLGASSTRIATRIVLPLAAPALKSATGLVFLMSFTSYGVVRILGGPSTSTVEVEVYRRAVQLGDVAGASVLAVAQTGIVLVVFSILSRSRTTDLLRSRPVRRSAPPWIVGMAFATATLISIPLVAMVVRSVYTGGSWTSNGWKNVFGSGSNSLLEFDLPIVLLRSLGFAFLAAAIAVPIGTAAAIGLARSRWAWAHSLLLLPVSTSAVAIGLGILVTYDSAPFDIRSSWWLIPVVHAVVAVPFVARTAQPVVESIPQGLRDAAAVLGASGRKTWFRIDAPLLAPALATGLGMSMALSLGEFGASSFLTRRNTETLPIVVERLLGRAGDLAFTTAMATSTVLLILTMIAIVVFDTTLRA